MLPPSLPLETTEMIIDHLYDDKTSLAACSITCRSWLSSSQHHLFDTITISAADPSYWGRKENYVHKFQRFIEYLFHHPHIRPLIHALTLRALPSASTVPGIYYPAELSTLQIYQIATQLPQLRDLFVVGVDLSFTSIDSNDDTAISIPGILETSYLRYYEHRNCNYAYGFDSDDITLSTLASSLRLFSSIEKFRLIYPTGVPNTSSGHGIPHSNYP